MKEKLRLKTIRQKIILSIFVVIALCILFSAFIVSQVVKDQMGEKYEVDKVAATESLSYSLAPVLDLYDYKQAERIITSSLTYQNIAYITVFNKGGILVVSATEQNVSSEDLDVEKYEITSNDKVIGSIEVGFSREYINEQIQTTTAALISGLAGFLILVGLVLFTSINRSVISPLGAFTKTVREVDYENLSLRVNIRSEDELGTLAGSFNRMAEDLGKSHSALKKAHNELQQWSEELERRVQERTVQLEQRSQELDRSNKELEQFAYVTSHDLREPLRMMTSFAQSLEKRYKDKLDKTADDYIQFIVDGAARMQRLIDDILIYSRVSTRTLPFEPVEMEEILRNALVNLRAATEEAKAKIAHDPLPVIYADPSQMGQVMQNLIGNAIKFHREEESPVVHISAKQEGKESVFSVKDNGIGIDPELFGRLFNLFQRLHPQDKYPGTGVGLAVTKKIVQRHGGRIWAESQPGKGSTFYFNIPLETKREKNAKQ